MSDQSLIYPRILLITGSVFNPVTAGGIMLTNLFSGWPRGQIATIYTNELPMDPCISICSRYYQLHHNEFSWMWPLSMFQPISPHREFQNTPLQPQCRPGVVAWMKQIAFGEEMPIRVRLSVALRQWIDEFRPELVYTILGSLPYIRLVRSVTTEYHIPYVVHMMDDWPQAIYHSGIIDGYRHRAMQRELHLLLDGAAVTMGICESMCEEYCRRYGREFVPFMNALNAEEWVRDARTQWQRGAMFRLLYAGTILPNSQLQSLQDVAYAVRDLSHQGQSISFDIYATRHDIMRYRDVLAVHPSIHIQEVPAAMSIALLFASADALVLPVNFDRRSIEYIQYSMPNKIPAYLLSGTPILVFGPPSVASVQYAREYQWGHVIDQRSAVRLKAGIQQLINDEGLRRRLALNAQRVGKMRHDAARIRPMFHNTLKQAVWRPVDTPTL